MLTMENDAADEARARAEIVQSLAGVLDTLRAVSSGVAETTPDMPIANNDAAARHFAAAMAAAREAEALTSEAQRLAVLHARTREEVARGAAELDAIAAARQGRAQEIATAQAAERGLALALERAQDDKAALARIGGDLTRADTQLNSLQAQITAATERRAELERAHADRAAHETTRETALLRQHQTHHAAAAGYARDEAATHRQAQDATRRQGAALLAGWRAHLTETTARAARARLDTLAAEGQLHTLRAQAREQLAPWRKSDPAIAALLAELARAETPAEPLDALCDAFAAWVRALDAAAASQRVPAYAGLVAALGFTPQQIATILQGRDVGMLRARQEQAQHARETVAAMAQA